MCHFKSLCSHISGCGDRKSKPGYNQFGSTLDHVITFVLIHHCWFTCYEAKSELQAMVTESLPVDVWGGLSVQTAQVHTPHFRASKFCRLERYMDWTSELD